MAADHSVDPDRWRSGFDELMGLIGARFGRVEPRRRARSFLFGLLAGLPRTNCWTIAEHAGDATPDGMQHLLARASWDAEAVREDLRDYVVDHLADPAPHVRLAFELYATGEYSLERLAHTLTDRGLRTRLWPLSGWTDLAVAACSHPP